MAENHSHSLRSMSLTQLRREAVSRGIRGMSKAPRETVYRAIRSTAVRPMSNSRRCDVYSAQRGTIGYAEERFTPRQSRRIRKGIRKAAGWHCVQVCSAQTVAQWKRHKCGLPMVNGK